MVDYLRSRNLSDGEVTAYTGGLIHLYPELGLTPPTRYVYLSIHARLFKSRVGEIGPAVEKSRQRYVVSSLRELGLPEECLRGAFDEATGLPVGIPSVRLHEFPFTQPVVFRSGEYLVHRVDRPIGRLCTDPFPLLECRCVP